MKVVKVCLSAIIEIEFSPTGQHMCATSLLSEKLVTLDTTKFNHR